MFGLVPYIGMPISDWASRPSGRTWRRRSSCIVSRFISRRALGSKAVRRCIANLVNNAVRHGRHVALAAWRKGNMIEITVDDDGPGIPAEERETVFRPFHRLDASRNVETGGVGLGLTIAREVVHGHGGEIFLEDSPMGGLRARIRLPV